MAADASAPRLASRLRTPSVVTTLGSLSVVMLFGWLAVNLWQTPADFFEVFLIGITTGCVYALVALGYTLVYGILELINFAHGDVCHTTRQGILRSFFENHQISVRAFSRQALTSQNLTWSSTVDKRRAPLEVFPQ